MSQDNLNRLPTGTLIGKRYRIEAFLNHGGFGNTYKAVDTRLADGDESVYVVVKEFFISRVNERDSRTGFVRVSNPGQQNDFDRLRRKFIREAKRIYRLRHPGIVRVSDVLVDENGTSYYVMDFIPGQSLSDLLHSQGALPEAEATDYICQLLSALIKVHKAKMLHLDIKPGNIMLDANGRAVLIDFGASKLLEADSGESSSSAPMVYTPGYAPIEQMVNDLRRIGPAADLYAVGATFYRLLTNQEPPKPTQIDEADSPDEVFQFPDEVSDRIRDLVVRLMAYRVKDRPDNAEKVYEYLTHNTAEDTLKAKRGKNATDWYESVFADPSLDSGDPAVVVDETEVTGSIEVAEALEQAGKQPVKEKEENKGAGVPAPLFKVSAPVAESVAVEAKSVSEPVPAAEPEVKVVPEKASDKPKQATASKPKVKEASKEASDKPKQATAAHEDRPNPSKEESTLLDGVTAPPAETSDNAAKKKNTLPVAIGVIIGLVAVAVIWTSLRGCGKEDAVSYALDDSASVVEDSAAVLEMTEEAQDSTASEGTTAVPATAPAASATSPSSQASQTTPSASTGNSRPQAGNRNTGRQSYSTPAASSQYTGGRTSSQQASRPQQTQSSSSSPSRPVSSSSRPSSSSGSGTFGSIGGGRSSQSTSSGSTSNRGGGTFGSLGGK